MKSISPADELASFIARYTPEIAAQAHAVLAKMRARLPGAVELVYDNYNFLVVGFGPGERASEIIFSIALAPRWINLFFFAGDKLKDPQKLLRGSRKLVRSIRLSGPEMLDDPAVQALMTQALKLAPKPIDPKQPSRIVIKSISAKQRPRRPK